jgi:hypothetical protein
MARKKYSCDFETTTDPNDCRVWAYGWMEIGNKKNFKIGNSMSEFMTWIEKCQGECYFHNLRFDGEFIVNHLLKNGFKLSDSGLPKTFDITISKMGQWYMIDICYGYKKNKKLHTRIYDSLKKLPFPVKKIAEDFHLEIRKGDIDYHQFRPIGHKITEEEFAYIKNDIEIVGDALNIQFEQGLKAMTNGKDSLDGFKAVISSEMFDRLFPIFTVKVDKNFRWAYRGGFTWLNEKYAGKEIGEGIVFDVNSLYPSQMYFRDLPFSVPIKFEGEYEYDENYPLYIQHIKCEFELKEGYIPCIQIKQNLSFKPNEYLKSSNDEIVELYVTNIDLKLMEEHYYLDVHEYVDGWKFKKKNGVFKQFIDKWMWVKTHEKGAKKLLAKLMLNSLYGKFATNPNVTGKVPYLKSDGSTGYTVPWYDDDRNIVYDKPKPKFAEAVEEFKDPVYTPMGVFITSWARYTTITTAQKCYDRIIYCDTDSIHLVGTEIPEAIQDIVDPDKLGYWKHESTFYRAKFLRQKTYVEDVILDKPVYYRKGNKLIMTNHHLEVKCAGMPDRIKERVTFENFEVGFTSYGKLLPKHVNGGVVLTDTEFTIK